MRSGLKLIQAEGIPNIPPKMLQLSTKIYFSSAVSVGLLPS